MKRAFITGITGQDGSYLAEHLLGLGYEVHGLVRRESLGFRHMKGFIENLNLHLHTGDVTDPLSLDVAFRKSQPDEIYNLAGQVFVPTSWEYPSGTLQVNTAGLLNIILTTMTICPKARIYQASTSEMYGNIAGPWNEEARMCPESPYGISKLASHELCRIYRRRGVYIVSGILFNHESPRRGPEMVTRKITRAIGQWTTDSNQELRLGNLKASRDWGFAGDYVQAMHLMLQQDNPEDFVVGTGETHTIEEFISCALEAANIRLASVKHLIIEDPLFFRPNEVNVLKADATKAKTKLGWEALTSFRQLAAMMVDHDIKLAKMSRRGAVRE